MRTIVTLSVLMLSLPVSAQQPSTPATVARATVRGPKALPPGKTATSIRGNAMTSRNEPLSNTAVRLRDARSGQIVETIVTDTEGLFAFPGVEPGSYIVEVLAADQSTVVAASELLTVNTGEMVSATSKLPLSVPPVAGMSHGSAASIAALAAQAASVGIVAVVAAGDATCPIQ